MKSLIRPTVLVLGALMVVEESLALSKRGIGWHIGEKRLGPVAPFLTAESNVGWWYDWNMCMSGNCGSLFKEDRGQVGNPAKNGAAFVPMVWTDRTLYEETELEKGFMTILHFNEPGDDGRSNKLTPAKAAEEWKKMVERIQKDRPDDWKDIKLVSPAPADDINWLVEFFVALCGGDGGNQWKTCTYEHPPHTVAVHAYDLEFATIKSKVEQYHTVFGRPIALTELAMRNFGRDIPSEQELPVSKVMDFMKECVSWLEDTDWVEMYAWLGASISEDGLGGVGNQNRLMDTRGELTELGKAYISLPTKGEGPKANKDASEPSEEGGGSGEGGASGNGEQSEEEKKKQEEEKKKQEEAKKKQPEETAKEAEPAPTITVDTPQNSPSPSPSPSPDVSPSPSPSPEVPPPDSAPPNPPKPAPERKEPQEAPPRPQQEPVEDANNKPFPPPWDDGQWHDDKWGYRLYKRDLQGRRALRRQGERDA